MDPKFAWTVFVALFGATMMVDALYHLAGAGVWYSDRGVVPYRVWKAMKPGGWSLLEIRILRSHARVVCIVYGLAAGLFAWTGSAIMATLVFVCVASLHARNRHITYGGDALIRMLLLCIVFGAIAGQIYGDDSVVLLQVASVQILLMTVYGYAGLHKISSRSWQNGSALALALGNRGVSRFPTLILAFPSAFGRLATWGTLAFEVCWFAAAFASANPLPFVAIAAAFHLSVWILLDVHLFSPLMLSGVVLFLVPFDLDAVGHLLLSPSCLLVVHLLLWDIPVAGRTRRWYRSLVGTLSRRLSLEHGWSLFAGHYPAAFCAEVRVQVLRRDSVDASEWPGQLDRSLDASFHRHRVRKFLEALGRPSPPLRGAFVAYVGRRCDTATAGRVLGVAVTEVFTESSGLDLEKVSVDDVFGAVTGSLTLLLGMQLRHDAATAEARAIGKFGASLVSEAEERDAWASLASK
jgi:hypothetical protein